MVYHLAVQHPNIVYNVFSHKTISFIPHDFLYTRPLHRIRPQPLVLLFVHIRSTNLLLQCSLLLDLIICLNLIVDLQIMEVFEADTALGTFAHFHNVLLDMLERVDFTWSESV